ncbi:glycosyltransferase family protein [Shimia marina]|uniref:Polysaccharide pyruvyl transferase n=1 Tax=Shimia marina TaxID=321267 RepID=A0A0P1FB69_9RHOB|nr:polysaccharide pyruvyl transferase family protein [Shimia marina]CUH53685.1 Polysaccharide pyruvyl transferase [Shimia marina]SFD71028.1 Polysaccharide pyruvyl transferase [Shimia marina]
MSALMFQHLRDTKNVGDAMCSPYDYFDWQDAQAKDLRTPSPDYKIGIYGGGKIFGGLADEAGILKQEGVKHIAWGVGTRQTFPISRKYSRARALCDLVGSRDYGDTRYDYAPCASCMSPLFDAQAAPEHDVVFYFHGGKTEKQKLGIPDDMPKLSNNCNSLEEALAFIASGKTVVSNSYHGVYWSLLMGRKTICVPFSNKFYGYRFKPAYATPKNWKSKLDTGLAAPEMLKTCRDATHAFKAKVDALIKEVCQ